MASSTSYFVNASSTALTVSGTAFFDTATSTTLNSNCATIGSLTGGALSLGSLGTFAGGFLSQASSTVAGLLTTLNSSSSLATLGTLWLPSITNALLSTDSTGKLVATSTLTAASFIATSTVASVFPYASSTAFTVSGTGYFGLGAFTSTTGTTTVASGQGFTVGGSQFVVQQGTGNVGIGTAIPGYALDVNGDVNVASGKCFRVNGICIGYVTKLAAIYATSTPGTNATVVFSGEAAPNFSGGTLTLPANTTRMVVEVWGGGGGGGGTSGDGSSGGTSSFGNGTGSGLATTTATGGGGGTAASNLKAGASGGTGSGGDVNLTGEGSSINGLSSGGIGGQGGAGGSAPRGGGGAAAQGNNSASAIAGNAGAAPGGGGSGASGASGQSGGVGGGGGGYSEKLITNPSGTYYYSVGAGGGGGSGTAGGSGGSGGLVITVYATSSPNAAGNDYAEMFPVSNPGITAGDIVAVDAGVPVSMKLAAAGGSAPLAGIIATNPGQLLGDKEAVGSRPVALSGRVPAKVNLEGGPIQIGDRIAPSSVPGVGKKASALDASVGIKPDRTV